MGSDQHVVRSPAGWAVVDENGEQPIVQARTRRDAIDIARRRARSFGSEVIVHSGKGQFRESAREPPRT